MLNKSLLIFILAISFVAAKDDVVIKLNKGIDFVLNLVHIAFTEDAELTIPLPSIDKPFGHPPMSGNIKIWDGYFKDPTSLHRTGDVAVEKHGDQVSLDVALGLAEVNVFTNYDLKVLGIHQNGTVNVNVGDNSIMLKITLIYKPACVFKVEYIKFDKLDKIDFKITGLGVFQTMFDTLSKWLMTNFETSLKDIINKKLYDKISKVVKRKDICKYFPH